LTQPAGLSKGLGIVVTMLGATAIHCGNRRLPEAPQTRNTANPHKLGILGNGGSVAATKTGKRTMSAIQRIALYFQ
jgi:hypothetical protein